MQDEIARDREQIVMRLEERRQQVAGFNEDALAAGQWSVGVWGRKERPGHVLRERDRIEVVRGLNVDPKEARRVRYRAQGEKLPKGIHRSTKARPAGPGVED